MPHEPSSIYLDCAATTPQRPEVTEAMRPYVAEIFGNPSSRHATGVRAACVVRDSAGRLKTLLGCARGRVVFTGGGTQANNLAVLGAARASSSRRRRIVVSAIEHASVLEPARHLEKGGFELAIVQPDRHGVVSQEGILAACDDHTALVCLMSVNNELGTIQPVEPLGKRLHALFPRVHFHVDAVQAPARLPVRFDAWNCDSLSICGHKIGGPKGIGALILSDRARLQPLLFGGGQQEGLWPGTENVCGIAGLARAIELAVERVADGREACKASDAMIREGILRVHPRAKFLVPPELRVAGIIGVRFPEVLGEVLLHHLDRRGIQASAGSACGAARSRPSHVLRATGGSDAEIRETVRFSFDERLSAEHAELAGRIIGETACELAAFASRPPMEQSTT